MPVFGTQLVPARIKIIIVFSLSMLMFSQLPIPQAQDYFNLYGLMIAFNQIIIGVAMGLFLQFMFQAFIIAGQLIAMQIGLGFASMVDPQNGVSVPAISQVYLMIVTLMYLSINGHLMAIEVLLESFYSLPIGLNFFEIKSLEQWVGWGSWMFKGALKIALPAIGTLLLVNFAFGVMTKAAPQLNIFTIGFPITMIFGILVIWLTLGVTLPGFYEMSEIGQRVIIQWANIEGS